MHIRIDQNTSAIEQVNSSILNKLFQLSSNNMLDASSNIIGRVHSAGAYADEVQWLMQNYQNLYITADKLYIKFQDPLTQQWCVTNFSSDGVGCSPEDLAAVTSINKTSFANSGIVNFDEFKYFTGITRADFPIDNVTPNTTLKSITLPNTITTIGQSGFGGGFFGFYALEAITIPSNCTLGQACFKNCTSLHDVIFGQNCVIGYQAFYGCSSLTSVDLGGVTDIGADAFTDCKVENIIIPNSVTHIRNGFLVNDGTKSITFEQDGVSPLVLEGTTGGYKPGVFRLIPSQKIVFPERLSELKNNALGCTAAMTYVFTSTTPPSVTGNGQITTDITNSKIYVPDSALADYKAATGFSEFASSIYPVSELPS